MDYGDHIQPLIYAVNVIFGKASAILPNSLYCLFPRTNEL